MIEARIETLVARAARLRDYMLLKIEEEDWHGVADSAMDMRDIESEIAGLAFALETLDDASTGHS